MSDAQPQATTHSFQAEVHQVLRLVINSLYSNKEIFLRELISNASDALDKLRFRALTEQGLTQPDETLSIRLTANKDAGTLTISDNGVGMTRDELIRNLGTVAHSGSREFLQKLQTGNADLSLIGQFGVGFYSAYLVADQVSVVSRAAGSDEAWRWISSAQETFIVEPTSRDTRGTDITLHLRDDQRDFLETWKLRSLVQQYSDFVSHPIQLQKETYKDEDADDASAKPELTDEFETVNQASALWRRKPSEVTDDQYADFYKHITHDYEGPLARAHFQIEGSQVFTGLLFVPKRPPFDLFERDQRHGVRLYV
jgi:molecular chaperone HtpG